jgi:hypothetical protein
MPTYNGWTIVTMPSSPAPKDLRFTVIDTVAVSISPFTGQQQVQNWQSQGLEGSVSLPPMSDADAQAWLTFLYALAGVANVFQFPAAIAAKYPGSITTNSRTSPPGPRYWRLKQNSRGWSIVEASHYGIQFDFREAF